jgi:glyoxylase-like metal-dependent hydrolase (beta-lactamase superfamily II)
MKLTAILLALASLGVQPASAQAGKADSTAFRSYQRAQAVLEKAIRAHGGLENIRAIENASVEYDGLRTMINQSRRAEGVWDKEPSGGKVVFDRKNNRMYASSFDSYPGIGAFGGAWTITGTEGFHWEPSKNLHGSEIMGKLSGTETDGPWAFVSRAMPPFLLLSAWENNTNLRWIESFEKDGRDFEAISVVQRDRRNPVVIIDAETFLLEGFEIIRDDGVYGDTTDFVRYYDYRDLLGVKFPTKRTEYFNNEIARELTLKFSANTTLDESLFKLPEGYSMPTAMEDDSPRIKKIGDGVYLDTEMGGIMIVEFKDFLLVVECPDNFWMSQSTIDAVKQAIPNKPIKYVVPSHTHGDHGGGARAYFHAGTTLITTRGNVEFYKKLTRIKQTIRPDPLSLNPKEPIIETFKGKRVITDGTQTVELYDVGPTSHSEELTVVHLPKQKILWQADLIFNPMTGGGINKAMPIGIEFAKKLKELGIKGFKQLVDAHHSRVVTLEEFKEGLRKAGYTDF